MPNAIAMIYSVNLSGHRQVYCDVLTDVLLELGYDVLLVVGLGQKGAMPYWNHIERYRNHPRVSIVDTYLLNSKQGWLSVNQIIQLQKQNSVSVTIYPCGDELRSEFTAIADGKAPKLLGGNMAIFGYLGGWFSMDGMFSEGLLWKERMRILRDKAWLDNPLHQFYEGVIRTKKVLDVALLKDERAANSKGLPFMWLPEIFRPYNWQNDDDQQKEFDAVIPAYQDFINTHPNKEILLYFGEASRYKGYDLLLKLATEDCSTVFVLCGTQNYTETYDENVDFLKHRLQSEGRFYETNRRLLGWASIDYFFESVCYYVSTHRIYGSSGTILQALYARKPLLTPNRGTIGYRTTKNMLGRIYNPNKRWDLFNQWEALKKDSTGKYASCIEKYIQCYSKDRVITTISQALDKCM